MMKIFMKIFYDGRRYHGFQRQPNVRTIENTLLDAISEIISFKFWYEASGRTDKGVHALGQTIAITLDKNVDVKRFLIMLDDKLPEDIIVWAYRVINFEWHARYAANYRTYMYVETRSLSDEVLHKVHEVFRVIKGTHNFTCLSTPEPWQDVYRRILELRLWSTSSKLLVYEITGDSFLRQMVRRILSMINMYVNGRLSIDDIHRILEGECLVLLNVCYPFSFVVFDHGYSRLLDYISTRMGVLSEPLLHVLSSRLYELL